jgi:hypothetical protein
MLTDWNDVNEGDVVRGKDGYSWTVSLRDGKRFVLTRDGKPPFEGKPSGRVEVLQSVAMEMEKAKALTQVVLGGEEVARKGPNGVWLVPSIFADPGSLLAHAYLFHAVTGDGGATLAELRTWHDEMHKADLAHEPHHHDPDYFKENRNA